MSETKYFNEETTHSNIMYWWHGVIQDDKYWSGCNNDDVSNEYSKIHDSGSDKNKKGFGKRYKVAIFGRHYAVKSGEDADWLEMAEAVYPVTAGSGLGGSKQTSALRQGAHVIGFYRDGKEGREPIILGCLGIHEENEPNLFGGDPSGFFFPRTGNKGKCKNEKRKPIATKDRNSAGPPVESNASPLQRTVAHDDKRKDGSVTEPILPPMRCEGPADILSSIKLLLNKLSYYTNVAKNGLSDLAALSEGIIKSVTIGITSLTNTLLDRMRGFVVNVINSAIKNVMNLLPPFLRPDANFKAQGILGGLACAFNKVKDKITDIVKDLTKQFVDNYVNAPLCAATSFLGGLLGNVIGEINGAVDTAVSEINKVLKIGNEFAGNVLDVLDFVLDLLKLFECEEDEAKCPDTTQWSFWNGPKDLQAQIPEAVSQTVENIINEVETVLPGSAAGAASNPCNSRQVPCGPPRVQITGGGGSGAQANAVVSATGAVLGLDFSVFGTNYISEPQITLVDSCGTGGGAVFQPIMRATGTKNQFQEDLFDLIGAIPIDSGTQYLPAPNGATGGARFILSGPSDTILFKTGSTQIINGREVKGTGYEVYPCGTTFEVLVEDEVYLPSGTIAEVIDREGNVVQTLNGLGQITKIVIESSGTLTAPCNPDNVIVEPVIDFPIELAGETIFGGSDPGSPTPVTPLGSTPVGSTPVTPLGSTPVGSTPVGSTPVGSTPVTPITSTSPFGVPNVPLVFQDQGIAVKAESYDVVSIIDSVFIVNPGFGFKSTDIIEILDNKGAELEFDVDEKGQVSEVRVLNGGLGFNTVPTIRIESETGYNFEAVAVFRFVPLSEVELNNITPPAGARLVSVVDCVGKILGRQSK